ncbi:MAG: hypothetical protein DI536_15970 [Archangium gephyra]|uniref:DUF7793 domain-containing protein n=1 Tax=Archangium gephyra TaxID=48 RepID=A0A2W5TF28_9BACT|nr:MAG: hypothetical protein DI536_15970 [Archangium gephyra]
MPIHVTEVRTPKGARVLRTEFVHEVTLSEAQKYIREYGAASPNADSPFLIVGNVTGLAGEVRKVLQPTDVQLKSPVAVVVSSAIARMLASLMLRASGGNDLSEFFKVEPEALEWIDEMLAKKR